MLDDFSSRQQKVFWLSCLPTVSATIKEVAGELFIRIDAPHQIMEDHRDGEGDENHPLIEASETSLA